MPAGPVEEGSIVAHIKGEMAQFDEAMDRAQARAQKLSTTKAEVKVTASVADAEAKLAAVDAAVNKVADDQVKASAKTVAARAAVDQASRRQMIAVDALKLAYQRLDDAQIRGGATETQLMALHLAAARAENVHEQATLKLAAANELLRASQDGNIGGPKLPSGGGGSSAAAALPGPPAAAPLVATGIAALVASLAPLAGYVAGVTGAFTMMGAAGVLAVFGIKNAMADGAKAGNTFSAGLQVLRGDFDALSKTAADAMLSRFQTALSTVDGAMPALNSDVRVFSGLLGDTGNIVLKTLISGFQTIMPLFVQAGVYVERLALGWQKWTTQGGLASFVRMAVTGLPQVANAFGSLLSGAVSVISGLAPLGTVILAIIGFVGELLQGLGWLLNNGFGPLIIGVGAAVGAFMLFTKVAPVVNLVSKAVTALGLSVDTALGPIGWIAAAVAGVGLLLATTATSADNAAQAMQNYTAAVQEDNGVIGKNIELQAAKALQDAGAFQTAQQLGISTDRLVKAALGEGDAQQQVTAAIKKKTAALDEQARSTQAGIWGARAMAVSQSEERKALNDMGGAVSTNAGAVRLAIKAYNDMQKAVGGTSISTKEQLQAQVALANQYGTSVSSYVAAVAAQKQTEDQTKATTLALRLENDAATLLTNAFTILNGGSLNVAQAQTGLAAANNSVLDSFRQNGLVVDGSTKAAVANQQAIQQQVQAAQQAAEAIANQSKSTEQGVKAYQDSKQQLEDNLKSQGLLTGAVQAYIDKLYDVADFKPPPTKLDVDDAAAAAKLAALQRQLDALSHGYTLILNANGQAEGRIILGGSAGKNSAQAHAGGGTVFGPGTSTSDSVPMWASVGEEYIKASSASQVRPLLKAINRDPAPAVAGVMALGAATAGKVEKHYHFNVVTQADPRAAITDAIRQQEAYAA